MRAALTNLPPPRGVPPWFFVKEKARTQKPDSHVAGFGAKTPWYLQYCEIAPGLQILLAIEAGENAIHFNLNTLQGQRKAEPVPPI